MRIVRLAGTGGSGPAGKTPASRRRWVSADRLSAIRVGLFTGLTLLLGAHDLGQLGGRGRVFGAPAVHSSRRLLSHRANALFELPDGRRAGAPGLLAAPGQNLIGRVRWAGFLERGGNHADRPADTVYGHVRCTHLGDGVKNGIAPPRRSRRIFFLLNLNLF